MNEVTMKQELITAFCEENMKTIYTYALSRVSRREDAEDLAGEIVLALLSSASRLRDEAALYGYIWSIAGNTCKKFLRRKSRHAAEPLEQETLEQIASEEDFAEELAQKAGRQEQLRRLRRELSLLSREYRDCTLCYYFEGMSCQETAEKLGISLEMTKYYLFKTRKLLKEGIGMEREYGTKSYKPALFTFKTIFAGRYNPEYQQLFHRLLPGNILLSAYYTPVTIRELALELGIPTAYLEDEAALLVKYGLLHVLPAGKESGSGRDRYQTNLVIFTEEYREELYEKLTPLCLTGLTGILQTLRDQLPALRAIGFQGAEFTDNRLLWPLLWLLLHRGSNRFGQRIADRCAYRTLYGDASGISVGINYQETDGPYTTYGFAGYSYIDDSYAASFADFGVLPPENRYLSRNVQAVRDAIYAGAPEYVIFDQAQLSQAEKLLDPQIRAMADLYEKMFMLAAGLLQTHAPRSVAEQIPDVIGKTLFFDTVGLMGKCALDSGLLQLPGETSPLAVFIYLTSPVDPETGQRRWEHSCQS